MRKGNSGQWSVVSGQGGKEIVVSGQWSGWKEFTQEDGAIGQEEGVLAWEDSVTNER